MGHLYGATLVDAVTEIREAAFRMPADGGASQGAGGQPPPNCLVLVAPDADAICASIILERVLTGEKVLHDIVPVAGYTEVVQKCRAFGPSLRSVVLVNCGAVPDIGSLLWPELPADPAYQADWWSLPGEAHVYVMDVHRPFKHHNVRDQARVTVLDYFGLPSDGDDVPRVGDSDAEDELDEADDEDEDDEGSEAEEASDGGGGEEGDGGDGDGDDGGGAGSEVAGGGDETPARQTKKRRRLRRAGDVRHSGDESDGAGAGRDDDAGMRSSPAGSDDFSTSSSRKKQHRRGGARDDEAEGGSGARPASKQLRVDEVLRAKRRAAAERYRRYYSGNHYGTPAALVAYEIAEQMAYGRNDLLWLAVVGLTEHFLMDHIDRDVYAACHAVLREKVAKLNDDAVATHCDEYGTRSKASRFGFIRPSVEPHFVAYRHWSLDSAMFYSEFVSTRLRDTEPDSSMDSLRRQLDRLPPLCGVPAKLLKQDYRLMPAEERRRFFSKLELLIRGEGNDRGGASKSFEDLTESLMYDSFVKQKDLEAEVCAGDVVFAMHGLLIGGAQAAAVAAREERLAGLMSEGGRAAAAAAAAREHGGGDFDGGDGGGGGGGSGEGGTQLAGGASSSESQLTSVISSLAGKEWVAGWVAAKDCLRRPELFYRGLAAYMALRQSVHRLGAPFASSRSGLILDGKILRLVTFGDGEGGGELTEGDRRLFAQPLALQALGAYIIRLNRDSLGRWRRRRTGAVDTKPLLIVMVHPKAGAHGEALASIQGFPVKEADHDASATHFADAFRTAAEMAEVPVFMDGFDSCAMLIADEWRNKVLQEIGVHLREGE